MISDRAVAKHVRACRTSMTIIRERVLSARLTRDATHSAWGQHLDGGRNTDQFGVYGTSAAIEILLLAETPADSPEIVSAYASLPFSTSEAMALAAHDVNDTSSTFKVAAVLEAAEKANGHPSADSLMAAMVQDRGWGNFWRSAELCDSTARVEPTCVALLALKRVQAFRSSPQCSNALAWLATEVTNREDGTPAADALALLTFTNYRTFSLDVPALQPAALACLNRLRAFRRKFPKDTAAHDEYHYEVPANGGFDSKYVFFPSHAIVALALLQSSLSRSADRVWASKLADTVAASVKAHGGYRVAGRVGTVDQMWAYRLLSVSAQLGATQPRQLVARPAALLTNARRRIAFFGILVAVGGAGGGLTLTEHSLPVKIIGFVLGGVALSAAAGAAWTWTGGESNDRS